MNARGEFELSKWEKLEMRTIAVMLLIAFAASVATAQIPDPPAELDRFEDALGNWTGSGETLPTKGADPIAWKSTMTYSKILDDYAVQEDVHVEIEEFGDLVIRTIYTWDPNAKRFDSFVVSNMGSGGHENVYWTKDDSLVGSHTGEENGQVVTDAWTSKFDDNSMHLLIKRSVAGGDFFPYVEGKYKKGGDGVDKSKLNVGSIAPGPKELNDLKGHLGTWKLKGKYSPFPGTPMMEVAATEKTHSILGGHAHFTEIIGADAPPKAYRSHSYLIWDQAANAYKSFSVDNFGGAGVDTGHRQDDNKMVHLSATTLWGLPQAGRTVVEWTEDGNTTKIKSHRLGGAHDPDVSFEATMTRVEDEEEEKN